MLPYETKALSQKPPFFKNAKKALALRQISELSELVNAYQVQTLQTNKSLLSSIYLPPHIFSFLLQNYNFNEYSDFGYSLFGHSVFDLPSEYISEYGENHIIVTENVFCGTYQHLMGDGIKILVVLPD